jgi:hypothetical protein
MISSRNLATPSEDGNQAMTSEDITDWHLACIVPICQVFSSYSIITIRVYELSESNKSNFQSKPRV